MPTAFTSPNAQPFDESHPDEHLNLAGLPVCKIIRSSISQGSFSDVLEAIVRLATLKTSSYVCLTNVHMLMEAYNNPAFNQVLNQATIAAPDGMPVSLLMRLLYHKKQDRIAGPDLMPQLFEVACQQNLSVFFYGSTPQLLERLKQKLSQNYPGLSIAGMLAPPFTRLTTGEEDAHIQEIAQSGARLVFVCLGCPKQELWMARHYQRIPGVLIGVGAAFSFYSGEIQRAPKWIQALCLEWLFRLLMEPGRLFKRYFTTNARFLCLAFAQWFLQVVLKRSF